MASYLNYDRICKNCDKEFVAKKSNTKCCSERCTKQLYKKSISKAKAFVANKKHQQEQKPSEIIKNSDQNYFGIDEAATFMRISRSTLFRLLKEGKLAKKKVLTRTIIAKEDIDHFFKSI